MTWKYHKLCHVGHSWKKKVDWPSKDMKNHHLASSCDIGKWHLRDFIPCYRTTDCACTTIDNKHSKHNWYNTNCSNVKWYCAGSIQLYVVELSVVCYALWVYSVVCYGSIQLYVKGLSASMKERFWCWKKRFSVNSCFSCGEVIVESKVDRNGGGHYLLTLAATPGRIMARASRWWNCPP